MPTYYLNKMFRSLLCVYVFENGLVQLQEYKMRYETVKTFS